jgi:hypothetical protein
MTSVLVLNGPNLNLPAARTQLGLEHDFDAPGVTLETSESDETRGQ